MDQGYIGYSLAQKPPAKSKGCSERRLSMIMMDVLLALGEKRKHGQHDEYGWCQKGRTKAKVST
jgi:hypothetical protein